MTDQSIVAEEDKKVLCQMLGRLYIPADLDYDKALQLKILTSALMMVPWASLCPEKCMLTLVEPAPSIKRYSVEERVHQI